MNTTATAPVRRSMTSREKKLVALYCSTTLALLLGCAFLFLGARRAPLSINTQAALKDPALRDEIVLQLSSATMGIFDSHNDPEVGRVLLLEQVDQVGCGTHPQQAADRFEDELDSALRRWHKTSALGGASDRGRIFLFYIEKEGGHAAGAPCALPPTKYFD